VRTLVVLPTYNEADNIADFLAAVRGAAPNANILVVDDNSPDGTGAIAEQSAASLGNIAVLHRAGKAGLGAAYRHGFAVAFEEGYDVIVSMDSDFSHDPMVIPAMVALIEGGADVVVGSRYVPGGGTVNWPIHRRLLSRWGNRYTGFVLRMKVRDCTSGFRAYRASSLKAADPGSTTAEATPSSPNWCARCLATGRWWWRPRSCSEIARRVSRRCRVASWWSPWCG